ncbi:MAG: 30S ribosomal protein S16 [Candidatus Krumholzibacteria bacterium]|nr:30S ribosomal protein S16 [Candidatus Krumholzibacteria bacterium]
MSTTIRLTRMGRKKRPFYRLVVLDSRKRRDGAYLANLGFYNPFTEPHEINIHADEIIQWLSKGATMSETARSLLRTEGVLHQYSLVKEGLDAAEIETRMNEWRATAEANRQKRVDAKAAKAAKVEAEAKAAAEEEAKVAAEAEAAEKAAAAAEEKAKADAEAAEKAAAEAEEAASAAEEAPAEAEAEAKAEEAPAEEAPAETEKVEEAEEVKKDEDK